MADREKLINRINKLLALADNNSNENEAQAAWNKAFALMKENNIAFSEVTMPGSEEDDDFSWWPEEDDDDDSSEFEDDEDLSWESEYEATRERARRYAEAKAQQEAYERGKQEAEAQMRRENQERARREAEARQAAAERAGRNAEERTRQEACRQAQMSDTEQKEEAVERSGTPKEEQSAQNINQANNARVDSETTDTLADGETFKKEAGIKNILFSAVGSDEKASP